MTIAELKDILSTYGVNDEERNAPVLVNIGGVPTPIAAGEVDYTPWDEGNRPYVLLQTEDVT